MVPALDPPLRENATVRPPEVKVLPAVSFAVRVSVSFAPEERPEVETVTRDCEREIDPGDTVSVGITEVTDDPPIVAARVVAVPDVVPVKVAVYVPLLLSVTEENVPFETPPVRAKAIVEPPVEIEFPLGSFAVKVTVTPVPEARVALETVTRDCEREIDPGVTVTVGNVEVTAEPLTVALMVVAVPEAIPVKVAV